MRALSAKYPGMSPLEKSALCQLVMFEAGRRWLWSLRSLSEPERLHGRKKYELVEQVCKVQERTEVSICKDAKFFSNEQMPYDKVSAIGYNLSEHYNYLMEHASLEANYEMCTILCEQSERIHQLTREFRDEWVRLIPAP